MERPGTDAAADHEYTVRELCELLRFHRNTILKYLRQQEFPGAYQVGGYWRIPRAAVAAFKDARRPKAVAA